MEQKNPSKPAGMSKKRFSQLRKVYKQKKAEVEKEREEIIKSQLEKGHTLQKAVKEDSPLIMADDEHLSDEEKEKNSKQTS